MYINVGQETITAKRDLSSIFPKEFSNRLLINQFIQYILNNFFEKSNEKIVSGYIGEVVKGSEGQEVYINEPTLERQMNQIIPVIKTGDDKIILNNYIASLHNDGCKVYDQNKMLSGKHWSWCPPINVDMYTNFTNYFWIGWDRNEKDNIYIFDAAIDVENEVVGQKFYTYVYLDEEGHETDKKIPFRNGMRVCFINDTGLKYNHCLYVVSGLTADNNGYLQLKPSSFPLAVLANNTNIVKDCIGKKNFTYEDEARNIAPTLLLNGMRVMFLNDTNEEYNNKIFMVDGVGTEIELIDDDYDPYNNIESDEDYNKAIAKKDYFVMERNCIDGNAWSKMNRWVHRTAIEGFTIGSLEGNASHGALQHAAKPILCFNKNIELYNYGDFSRGNVLSAVNKTTNEINAKDVLDVVQELNDGVTENFITKNDIVDNAKLLLLGNDTSTAQLYTIKVMRVSSSTSTSELVVLNKIIDDRSPEGLSTIGDTVTIMKGDKAGQTLYFDGAEWVKTQEKVSVNCKPLFNLYDTDKVVLDNPVNYPESTFKGCSLFEYKRDDDPKAINDVDLDMPIVFDAEDLNYYFVNTLESDTYYYTPLNDYEQKIDGYRFFKINGQDVYLNDWYLNQSTDVQYIKTQSVISKTALVKEIDDKTYYEYDLDYTISKTSDKSPCIVYCNGNIVDNNYIILNDKSFYIQTTQVEVGDTIVVKLLTDDEITVLNSNYCYETPLSLIVNQYNENINEITYNESFDQMIDIISNQNGLVGSPSGSNNYSSIENNLSVGTRIVQNVSSIIKSMVLSDNVETSVRCSLEYSENAYVKFKQKFQTLLNRMYLKGIISEEQAGDFESDETSMDTYIIDILNQINIGKEGLQPFYNNGVTYLVDNGYIPATPAYLGIANNYEPRIEIWEDFTTDNKPKIIIGHDGSFTKATDTVKDRILLRFEKLIYDSILPKFKDTKPEFNYLTFMPGKFRTGTYSKKNVLDTYSPLFESWCSKQNVNYSENINFQYDSTAYDYAWKTWNYTGCFDLDNEPLQGSYRAIYMYYYDTYRPDTHPWEMLGFGDKPSWWEDEYGPAPYTSSNMLMWQDIENGYIKGGAYKGYHEELKRPGLVMRELIPVDNVGKLKSPKEIGIIKNDPTIQNAKKGWVVGDIGDLEFAYMQTSESKYDFELVKYFLKPVDWLETGWDTENRETLFRGTSYEQIIDASTNSRENISKIVMHNELVDGSYVRKIGIQQWISDYLTSDNLNITTYADKIRNSEVVLGYRCSGYYQKGTVEVAADAYGVLPEENIHMTLLKSKNDGILTYSAMAIQRTRKGYVVDGFDDAYPYFTVRKPEKYGKKSSVTQGSLSVYYYHNWKDDVELIPYKKEFTSIQDVYDVIIGYGKYLEDNEAWYFTTRSADGVVMNFRTSGESFLQWASVLSGEQQIDNIILLNPGVIGIGNYNVGIVEDLNQKICGENPIKDINGDAIKAEDMEILRNTFNTYLSPRESNLALLKLKTYNLEHLLYFDNKTVYGDVLYDSKYNTVIGRLNVYGVKVNKWYGTLFAPGYLIEDEGAISNYEKKSSDLRYIYDTDDPRCQGNYGEYSKAIVGYNATKTYKDLYRNDKAMFDFYKGVIQEKGTKSSIAHMNRTKHVSSTGREIELYEKWAFREGEFGHIKDNSVLEFILEEKKMNQNPQVITFESSVDNYYRNDKVYNAGDVVVYNNYEYICKFNNVSGEFNYDYWKNNRFVGNYIIYSDNKNWIKKPKNLTVQTFKYSDNLLVNPIGGFAQIDDCEYIVANDEELGEVAEVMKIGETVWVVKTTDGDWDIRKKTGVNKFVSMRYFTLADALKQPEYDYVYHFTDDRKEYFANKNSNNIDISDTLYEDIDLNNPVCKWADIGKPEYTGNVGTYVFGKEYKVKLYNTVFYTQAEEDELNNGTPFKDIYGGPTITYSNLLLNMTEFGTTRYKYKWQMKIKVQTKAPNVKIVINGTLYSEPKNNEVELIVCEGDIINWEVSAYASGTRSGTVNVQYVTPGYEDLVNPTDAQKKEYHFWQQLNVTVPLSYRPGTIIYDSATPQTNVQLPLVYSGEYEVSLVGAGGGAGGGSGKKHHRHGGGAGASGSYLHGNLTITDEDLSTPFYITTGSGGSGGIAGHSGGLSHGHSGGDSSIVKGTEKIVSAQGGCGGVAARCYHYAYVNGRLVGTGGKNFVSNSVTFDKFKDSKEGNNGCILGYEGYPGTSVYPKGTYGAGGWWVYRGTGHKGNNGYAQVKLAKVGTDYVDYSQPIEPEWVTNIVSREVASTDSLEYSAYYQPYVVPYDETTGEIQYFYSYDILYEDGVRDGAEIVNTASSFYRNRAKSITAYHKPSVTKGDIWVNASNKKYYVGDTTNVVVNNQAKYYICENDVVATGNFVQSEVISGETVVYWREYSPTYYYKITYNGTPITEGSETDIPTNARYSGINYELYEDENCTVRAEKSNGDYLMTCDDLDFTRGYTNGSAYTLVDKFASYAQIMPKYISLPTWMDINPVATYEVVSGGVSYYEDMDRKTVESDEESLVYTDSMCSIVAQAVKQTLVNDKVKYEYVDVKYSNLLDVEIDHLEPSYELKDKDNYFYTSESINDLTDDTKLYSEYALENEVGIYKDYIPVWEKVNTLSNPYTNIIDYIKYEDNDNTGKVVKLKDYNNKETDFYYTLDGNTFYHFCAPSVCDTGLSRIEVEDPLAESLTPDEQHRALNKIKLYTCNKYIVQTEEDKETISDAVDGDILRVIESSIFYVYSNNRWSYLATNADMLTKYTYFKHYPDPEEEGYKDRLYVNVSVEENNATLYPESDYIGEEVSQGDTETVGDTNNNIKLYYNAQSEGKFIDSGSIIEETSSSKEIQIMCQNYYDDPMYISLNYMFNIRKLYPTYTWEQCYDFFALNYSEEIGYINRDELITLSERYISVTIDGITSNISNYVKENRIKKHSCQIYNMYRSADDNNIEYTRLYRYGNWYYKVINIYDNIKNTSEEYGIYLGTVEQITTYVKNDRTYSDTKTYDVGDLAVYDNVLYRCIVAITTPEEFDINKWEVYYVDKIVNVILYKEKNDLIYITNDSYDNRNSVNQNTLIDEDNIITQGGTLATSGKRGWMKVKYINEEYTFNLEAIERKRIRTQDIKSCYLVDNSNDNTISEVQVFDPIQNIIPNNILEEVQYISSIDPVNDYNDSGKWGDGKVGFLWWDTSKVRYVDYYQGDYEYRRQNWGKQLPGSEIAIMEWQKSYNAPTDGRKYITKTSYNYETSTVETYYYFWEKNPIDIPQVAFRKNSAFHISKIINNPTLEGIVWMSPIDANVSGINENTLILCNYNNVISGQQAVLQINMDSDVDIQSHTEWVMVKENSNATIPDFLWEKMRDSLLGYKEIDGEDLPVPSEDLEGRQRLGISFRPRQTMFDKLYNARQNFIQCINDIFGSRTDEELNDDMISGLDKNTDQPDPDDYYDSASTKLEMMSWKDETLVGKNILVEKDESLNGIWAIYRIEPGFTYTLVDYEKYDIMKYLSYKDWYANDTIQYLTPIKVITSGQSDAKQECEKLEDLQIVKYLMEDGEWELWQNQEGHAEIVAKSNKIMHFSDEIYDYVNDDTLNKTDDFIILEDGTKISEYDYVANETLYILKVLIDYFGNIDEELAGD